MIPDGAVEAAHKAWREQAALEGSIFEYNLRAALEAAAPHLMAAAWDEGKDAVWTFMSNTDPRRDRPSNPYRKAPDA